MPNTASYTPIFRGQFPADARTRWAVILEVSLFCEPATLDMPPFLQAAMKQHVELRQKHK